MNFTAFNLNACTFEYRISVRNLALILRISSILFNSNKLRTYGKRVLSMFAEFNLTQLSLQIVF